jgi:hypothetical protein
MLKCKSEELSQKISNNQFIATDGWLSRWKNRHEIKFKCVHGEKVSADVYASNNWKFELNADKIGLCYRAIPEFVLYTFHVKIVILFMLFM